jgi:hypothetical protein
MHLPAKNSLLLSMLALLILTVTGCAKVNVTRADQTYAAREAGCPVSWQHGSYQQLSGEYEWLGEVTLRNERGVVLSQADRDLLEAQACQLGGDALVRTSGVRQEGAGLAAFGDQRYAVLRHRAAPAASGSEAEPATELPKRAVGGETIARSPRRPREAVR